MKKYHVYIGLFSYVFFMLILLSCFIAFGNHLHLNTILCGANLIMAVAYYYLLLLYSKRNGGSEIELAAICFMSGLVGTAVYNGLFYAHHGDFFGFMSRDPRLYDEVGRLISEQGFYEGLKVWSKRFEIDDWGFPIYVGLLYKLVQSPLTVNFGNIFVNTWTVILIFRLGQYFLDRKTAFWSALMYGCSSYVIFFLSDGTKEIVMIFFVVCSYYYYSKYLADKKRKYVVLSVLVSSLLVFFRIPLMMFILFSVVINEMQNSRNTRLNRMVIIGIVTACTVGVTVYFNEILREYYRYWVSLKAFWSQGDANVAFRIATSIVSGFFGPFPTLLPVSGRGDIYMNLSCFSSGLIIKILFSPFLIFGIRAILNSSNPHVKPIFYYVALETVALIFFNDTFELRKALPHFSFAVLLSVYCFESMIKTKSRYPLGFLIARGSAPFLMLWTLIWNYARLF